MPLTERQIWALENAICNYCYPMVTYDFDNKREIGHQTMRSVENTILGCLTSNRPNDVKNGLSNVLYWGYRRTGYYWTRVDRFRNKVTSQQLQSAIQVFQNLEGTGLRTIKQLGLPEFSNLSFLSKLRMFLNPQDFVTLDRKLMKLAQLSPRTLFAHINERGTYIPVTDSNERYYQDWCNLCRKLAETYFGGKNILAVDIERGIFQLVENGQLAIGAGVITNI